MLEDYEGGMRRKTTTRHTVGRMRWLLLASVFVNIILAYKYWSHSADIVVLRTKNMNLNADMMTEQKQIEHYKKQATLTDERRSNCEKRMSENEDKTSECQIRHKECSDTLESTSSKLMELNDALKNVNQDKEKLQQEIEEKSSELESVKEQVMKLQKDIEEYQRNSQSIVTQLEVGKSKANSGIVSTGEQVSNIQTLKPEKTASNTADDVDGKEKLDDEKSVYIDCDFSEDSSDSGKCNYMKKPSDPHWEFGRPSFLREQSTQSLYVDDSITDPGLKMNIVFETINTNKCLEMSINVTIVGGGQLSVVDNEKPYEVTLKNAQSQVPVWEMQKFNFNAAPSHALEISGTVNKYGGVALTRITVTDGECPPDIQQEIDFEDEAAHDADKAMVEDLAK